MTSAPTRAAADLPSEDTHELAVRLRLGVTRLARTLRREGDATLSPTQLAALATVERSGPLPLGVLADLEQITAPSATKVVDRLADLGFVAREPDPADRRVIRVGTTPEGRAFLDELRARKTAWLTTRLHELSPDELAALGAAVEVLERLTEPPGDQR